MKNKKLEITDSKFDTNHIAKLANLTLSDQEINIFSQQFASILTYIERLRANTETVDPTYNVSPNINVTREDTPNTCLTQDEALQNGSNTKNGQFVTKGVFENE